MSKIGLDLGHGVGSDRGANGCIAEEEIINSVGGLVINKLRALGHEVIECRPSSVSSVSDSLSQRVNKANNNNVDLFVSIHANAGGGVGTEVFTYNGNRFDKAVNVLNNIVALGFKNRGIKPSNNVAYVVNHTNAKAMLIEVCFVDTQSDVNLYRSIGAEKIADAIVKGLVGQTTVVNTPQPQVKPQPVNNNISNTSGWVARLQNELNNQGFRDCNGNRLTVDNIAGEKTLSACPIIKRGAKGNITRLIQEKLNSLGFNCGAVDGDFGGNTYNAVVNFQRSRGLSADGIIGKNTWRKLLGL